VCSYLGSCVGDAVNRAAWSHCWLHGGGKSMFTGTKNGVVIFSFRLLWFIVWFVHTSAYFVHIWGQ
jgi:hypothetical protein